MKKVLFVAYGGGHVNIVNLIAKKLLKENDIEFKILALTTAYKKVIDIYGHDIVKSVTDYMFLFENHSKKIQKYGKKILGSTYKENSGLLKEELINYLGLSMFDLVNNIGEKNAFALYEEKKRNAFLPVDAIKKILLHENIDIVLSTTAPRFEQASFIAANQLNISTVEVLDLFGDLYPLPEAENIVVMNEDVKERLIERGLDKKQYFILGQPSIEESVKDILNTDAALVKQRFGLNNTKKTILLATQQLVETKFDFSKGSAIDNNLVFPYLIEELVKLAETHNYNFILRTHPNENINSYKEILNKYNSIVLVNSCTVGETIAMADLVVTHSSTIGVEAVASNKTVFTFMHGYDKQYPVPTMMKPPFNFSNSIELLLEKIKYNTKNDDFKKHEQFMPKNSVENIIKLLKKL